MPEELKDGIDLKSGGIGVVGGALLGALIMFGSVDKTEIVTEATIADKLAVSDIDSMTPARELVYLKADPKDSSKTVKDTVVVAPRAVLKGFSENGVSDYEIAYIMQAGKKYQVLFIEDGIVLDATEYTPKANNWLLSLRPRTSLHEGK